MHVSDEHKELLSSLRIEYANIVQIWKYLAGTRALLLIVASTVIGTVMNLYRSGLATFKTAHILGTGQIVSVVSDVPTLTATSLASVLVGAVVVVVLTIDIAAGKIQGECSRRGLIIERELGLTNGMFNIIVLHWRDIYLAFLFARGIMCTVALSWAVVFFYLSA